MKRVYRPDLSVSRRDMAPAMSCSNAIDGAARYLNALRFYFFVFWFMKRSIRES